MPSPSVVRVSVPEVSVIELVVREPSRCGRSNSVSSTSISVPALRACVLIDAALTVRRGLRELPKHDRPLVARLVA